MILSRVIIVSLILLFRPKTGQLIAKLLPSGYLGFVSEFWIMVENVETWDEREQNLSSGAV